MENIIALLQEKSYHLKKFSELNEVELVNFVEGNFENLEVFYNSRDALLDLVKCIDRLLDQANAAIDPAQISDDQRRIVKRLLDQKDEIVEKILAQDLQILSVLETAKSGIIRELRQVQSARKAMGVYKGNDHSNRLDEEA